MSVQSNSPLSKTTCLPGYDEIVRRLSQLLPTLRAAYLFGSAADSRAELINDLDIAVHLLGALTSKARWDIQQTLSVEWNIDVDLIDFANASGTLRQQVLTHGIRLYAADVAWQDGYEAALINEHLDFLDRRLEQDRYIVARGRVYGN
jgi:uncharacterized protein